MKDETRKRQDIKPEYKWKLEDIYADENLWENDFKQVKELAKDLEKFQGTLNDSADQLGECIKLSEKIDRQTEKLYIYAKMRRDEDNANSRYQTLFDRVEGLSVEIGSIASFIIPEITLIPEDKLAGFIKENSNLKLYQHFFDEITRQKAHILSQEEERLLAMTADLSSASGNIFTMLNNADIKFPQIKDEEGKEIELTKGRFGRFMESGDRNVREAAFKGLYSSYQKLSNTLGASLSSSVKKDIFYARARKYSSALEASLDQDNVSPKVYGQLIASVHDNLNYMYRYMELRKKLLKLDELHMYDLYVPLVSEYKVDVPYEQAKKMVIQGLQPLGEQYISTLKKGMESGWIDVYENQGKTGGAYSWGSYDTHPYVLLNYDNKLDDAFTLAHEMGHSLHSYYSNQAQPFVYSQYTIFVAEVASTVNESLLIDYRLSQAQKKEEKMFLLNHYLEQFRGTVYRQTMFAEFEQIIHQKAEQGEALTPELFSNIYHDLNALYYGPQVVLDGEINIEWARIPHFYSAFYVYKYATGFSAATSLKQQILTEGQPAVDRYLEFLKSGSSQYPLDLLKSAGVDLTTSRPVEQALQFFGQLVAQLEEMAG